MFQHTQPAGLDESAHGAWSPFRVDASLEVAALLRQLREEATPLVLSAPAGAALVARLWAIDEAMHRITLSVEEHDPALAQLVDADEAVAVGYLDNIKLQFDLSGLLLVRGPRSSALQATLPRQLYRFQRRSAYRVRPLDRPSPTACLRHPAIPDMRLTLRLIDISSGGCALLIPDDVPALEPGVQLHGVQVELAADTVFVASLQIQHMSSLHGNNPGLRAGCEWRGLAPDAGRALQRYIDQTQKRRRLLALE
jgi:c-di-GMP-binding flagellar brake protein YcgR